MTEPGDRSLTRRRARWVLDAALLVCAAVVGWRLVDIVPSRQAVPPPVVERGATLRLAGVDWTAADRNIALVMSSTCEATRANLAHYKEIARRTPALPRARFLVIGQEPADDIHRWMSAAGISPYVAVRTFTAAESGLTMTPMLLSVDASGVVTRVITGRLAESAYDAVLEDLLR